MVLYIIQCKQLKRKRRKKLLAICIGILLFLMFHSLFWVHYVPVQQVSFCQELKPCHKAATCFNSFNSYVCKCNQGFYGDGKICFDLDECKLKAPCIHNNQKCINTIGSYQCVCKRGFHMTSKSLCKDIDECIEHKPCHITQDCVNKPGSYQCICRSGFKWNGKNCTKTSKVCSIPDNSKRFPKCKKKVTWMKLHWKSHACYKEKGVDGSQCSILRYLSEVENECPLLDDTLILDRKDPENLLNARINMFDNGRLMTKILTEHDNFKWMKNRISSMWEDWQVAYKSFSKKEDLKERPRKDILIYIGILTDVRWGWARHATEGGPLGELVQWTDLIVSLFLLGHDLYVPATDKNLKQKNTRTPCSEKVKLTAFDLIYTDVRGLSVLKTDGDFHLIKCKLRIVDTFGTEARFNYDGNIDESEASLKGDHALAAKLTSNPFGYGHHRIHLKQFWTMFPHSPDNSFLGFAVSKTREDLQKEVDMSKKEDIALVYGKKSYMWKGQWKLLSVVNETISVIGTVAKNPQKKNYTLPNFVKNKGLMKWNDYQKLLSRAKIFIGLGFPFEGPAPLEAIAKGVVFLNPKYNPPLNRLNDRTFDNKKFFEGKPTLREITSQHPYMENFIGKPHVYTVDIKNEREVRNVLLEILEKFRERKIHPYTPFEFTHEGMLQRLNAFIENQEFCRKQIWPGRESLLTVLSNPNESCKTTCKMKGLICDNGMFPFVNNTRMFLMERLKCTKTRRMKSLLAPYFYNAENVCVFQEEELLYSCVDAAPNRVRICPCRKFLKEQVSLCPDYANKKGPFKSIRRV